MFGFLSSKKLRVGVGAVGGFGKIAGLGDFVRTPSASEEMLAFEGWLTRAMETAEARTSSFKDRFQVGSAYGFLWTGVLEKKQRGCLAGVLQPSVDAVGRRYPVVIAAPLPATAFAAHPHAAPMVLHEFWSHAGAAAARASRMRTQAEFHAEVASVQPPTVDGAASLSAYESWAKQPATGLWTELFPDDAERASKWALYLLVEAVKPYRGQELPPQQLGMRVPLGADRARTTALWVDLVRNAAGWKTTVPSMFVPLVTGDALIQLGADAPASVLADLYTPDDDSESVCNAAPSPTSKLPSELPSSVDRATSDDALLGDVAAALAK